ncbi:MAG: glycosyltransferase [Candidatus Atribacteria bacterium]|nr:glycosyltransferase [Candidatus Atribacteria bacterium]
MFAVARYNEIKVIAPIPFFPFLKLLKKFDNNLIPTREIQDGIDVYHPRFFYIPGLFKFLDGFFYFLSIIYLVIKIKKEFKFELIDAHFAYPDGLAAVLISKALNVPVIITLRGVDVIRYSKYFIRKLLIKYTLNHATEVISVSNDLRLKAIQVFNINRYISVIPNGIDLSLFKPIDKNIAREKLELPLDKEIILSIGGLVERKGFHRVIKILPSLLKKKPNLLYIIVGGPCREGNIEQQIRKMIKELSLENHVLMTGEVPNDAIGYWINAADIFCLVTSNEGWANVFFEAFACGKPVVTTKIGGNPEVIKDTEYGILIELNSERELEEALIKGLDTKWNKQQIINYAKSNTWEYVAKEVIQLFEKVIHNQYNLKGNIVV